MEYMVTGSVASSLQGEPRATHDIDIVVEMSPQQVPLIRTAFPQNEYAFDEVAAVQAIFKRDMFQLSEFSSGDKIDFWVLKDNPFDQNVFSRRTPSSRTSAANGCALSKPRLPSPTMACRRSIRSRIGR